MEQRGKVILRPNAIVEWVEIMRAIGSKGINDRDPITSEGGRGHKLLSFELVITSGPLDLRGINGGN